MLVLSRRCHESIVLPELNVTITVVAAKSGAVRLGIDAPPDVPVVRQEIAPPAPAQPPRRQLRHAVRNRLNALNIGLSLMRQQLQAGLTGPLERTLDCVEAEVRTLSGHLDAALPPAAPRPLRRALLVEDDQNERELLAGCLRLAGVDVTTAGDGADALDHLRRQELPDLILLDMILPRCDGPTTISAIRSNPALDNVRIFAMTGHSRDRFQIAERVDGWFEKPLDVTSLMRRLGIRPAQ